MRSLTGKNCDSNQPMESVAVTAGAVIITSCSVHKETDTDNHLFIQLLATILIRNKMTRPCLTHG